MGSTLDALNAGSINYSYVIAIEGFNYLLTDGDPALAVTAWVGTEWSQAIGDVAVDVQNDSSIDVWNPFTSGGTCKFFVPPSTLDIFGIATHRSSGGAETELAAALPRNTATVTVKNTTPFAASGEAHIGNECFAYTAKTATTFTGVTRGKYAPFAAGALVNRCAELHRFGSYDFNIPNAPVVSQFPRAWIGRWVGVWIHRSVAGVLDVKSQAHLIYAGRIADLRDDAATGSTAVDLDHVLDAIKDRVILEDQWSGKVAPGVFLEAGIKFDLTDFSNTTQKAARTLTVKVGANPLLGYETEQGQYTLEEIVVVINRWLDLEYSGSFIFHRHVFNPSVTGSSGPRGRWNILYTGASTTNASAFLFPNIVLVLMGWAQPSANTSATPITRLELASGGSIKFYETTFAPRDIAPPLWRTSNPSINLSSERGTYADQTTTMPAYSLSPVAVAAFPTGWGLYIWGGVIFTAKRVAPLKLDYVYVNDVLSPGADLKAIAGDQIIQQIFVLDLNFRDLLRMIFYSTDTVAYNGANDRGISLLGIPAELLGTAFDNSCASLTASDAASTCIVRKPTKLVDVIGADLILRRANLIWKNQKLQFVPWSQPTVVTATKSLSEDNKADPQIGAEHRTASSLSSQWMRNVVKVEYNRDLTTDDYLNYVSLIDRTSIDDAGGVASPITISARNTYGVEVADVLRNFLTFMPFFSRQIRLVTRSIDLRFYENLSPGDVVTFTDSFARDPATGARGVAARAGLVTSVKYSLGGRGLNSDSVDSLMGEATIAVLDTDRAAAYAPSAIVDKNYVAAGFANGYDPVLFKLAFQAHGVSEAAEPLDAANFAVGDKITIVETDPLTPGAPIAWARTVGAVSGNEITLTAALATPAYSAAAAGYRIFSQTYSAATTNQKTKSYQALASTGVIEVTGDLARVFVSDGSVTAFTASNHADVPELVATLASGDGKPYDAGTDLILARNANWLQNHGTRHHTPFLTKDIAAYTIGTANYGLICYSPIFIGGGRLQGGARRMLAVAPWFRSATGAAVSLRVTLMAKRLSGILIDDVVREPPYAEIIFTTSSTLWTSPAAQNLDLSVIDQSIGYGYLVVEMQKNCETRGLTQCGELEIT